MEIGPPPDSVVCSEFLLVTNANEGDKPFSKPLKPFLYPSFYDYVAQLLSRCDLENYMDTTCDDLKACRSVDKPE
jgi:hypothetical protein